MPELKQHNIASAALHLHCDELPGIHAMFRPQYSRVHSFGSSNIYDMESSSNGRGVILRPGVGAVLNSACDGSGIGADAEGAWLV